MDSDNYIAGRVFQMEASNLDNEFENIIDESIDGLSIPVIGEELKLFMKLFTFLNHIKDDRTIGMKVYNMNYTNGTDSRDRPTNEKPMRLKLLLLTCSNLIMPYIVKRSAKIGQLLGINLSRFLKLDWLTLENAVMATKLLGVVNFLEFLRDGKHLTIQERLINLVPVISEQDYFRGISLNKMQMELLYRETIWKVMAEFLTTIIPLVNLTRVKNQVLRATGLFTRMGDASKQISIAQKIMSQNSGNKCAICGEQPFNPYIIGCRHIFCYYCIRSRHLSDPSAGHVCHKCNYSTHDPSQVQRYRIHQLHQLAR